MPMDAVEVAKQLTENILRKDVDAVVALYDDDAIVWRNVDGRALVKKQMRKIIEFLVNQVRDLRYDDVRIHRTDAGFVQQHTLRGVAPNGTPFSAHACVVATVENGKILRLDEYVDSAAMAPLFA